MKGEMRLKINARPVEQNCPSFFCFFPSTFRHAANASFNSSITLSIRSPNSLYI